MAFKGKFNKFTYLHGADRPGHDVTELASWTFDLTNTSWFGSKQVSLYITDFFQRQNRTYPFEARSGATYRFNLKTVDWNWGQGDTAILYDAQGQVIDQWQFFLKEYAPGQCPECHGTKKCGACKGNWLRNNPNLMSDQLFIKCNRCYSTGRCQTCDIPYHLDAMGNEIYVPYIAGNTKSVASLQREINSKQQRLQLLMNEMRQLQLQGRANSISYMKMKSESDQLSREIDALNMQLRYNAR